MRIELISLIRKLCKVNSRRREIKGETKARFTCMGLAAYNGPRSRCVPLGGERVASRGRYNGTPDRGYNTALLSSTL